MTFSRSLLATDIDQVLSFRDMLFQPSGHDHALAAGEAPFDDGNVEETEANEEEEGQEEEEEEEEEEEGEMTEAELIQLLDSERDSLSVCRTILHAPAVEVCGAVSARHVAELGARGFFILDDFLAADAAADACDEAAKRLASGAREDGARMIPKNCAERNYPPFRWTRVF